MKKEHRDTLIFVIEINEKKNLIIWRNEHVDEKYKLKTTGFK